MTILHNLSLEMKKGLLGCDSGDVALAECAVKYTGINNTNDGDAIEFQDYINGLGVMGAFKFNKACNSSLTCMDFKKYTCACELFFN